MRVWTVVIIVCSLLTIVFLAVTVMFALKSCDKCTEEQQQPNCQYVDTGEFDTKGQTSVQVKLQQQQVSESYSIILDQPSAGYITDQDKDGFVWNLNTSTVDFFEGPSAPVEETSSSYYQWSVIRYGQGYGWAVYSGTKNVMVWVDDVDKETDIGSDVDRVGKMWTTTEGNPSFVSQSTSNNSVLNFYQLQGSSWTVTASIQPNPLFTLNLSYDTAITPDKKTVAAVAIASTDVYLVQFGGTNSVSTRISENVTGLSADSSVSIDISTEGEVYVLVSTFVSGKTGAVLYSADGLDQTFHKVKEIEAFSASTITYTSWSMGRLGSDIWIFAAGQVSTETLLLDSASNFENTRSGIVELTSNVPVFAVFVQGDIENRIYISAGLETVDNAICGYLYAKESTDWQWESFTDIPCNCTFRWTAPNTLAFTTSLNPNLLYSPNLNNRTQELKIRYGIYKN